MKKPTETIICRDEHHETRPAHREAGGVVYAGRGEPNTWNRMDRPEGKRLKTRQQKEDDIVGAFQRSLEP